MWAVASDGGAWRRCPTVCVPRAARANARRRAGTRRAGTRQVCRAPRIESAGIIFPFAANDGTAVPQAFSPRRTARGFPCAMCIFSANHRFNVSFCVLKRKRGCKFTRRVIDNGPALSYNKAIHGGAAAMGSAHFLRSPRMDKFCGALCFLERLLRDAGVGSEGKGAAGPRRRCRRAKQGILRPVTVQGVAAARFPITQP